MPLIGTSTVFFRRVCRVIPASELRGDVVVVLLRLDEHEYQARNEEQDDPGPLGLPS